MAGGGLFFGILGHFWYQLLDKRLPGKSRRTVLKKLGCEMLAGPPIGLSFFLVVGGFQGKTISTSWQQFKENLILLCVVGSRLEMERKKGEKRASKRAKVNLEMKSREKESERRGKLKQDRVHDARFEMTWLEPRFCFVWLNESEQHCFALREANFVCTPLFFLSSLSMHSLRQKER